MEMICKKCANVKTAANLDAYVLTADELQDLVDSYGDKTDRDNYFADGNLIQATYKGLMQQAKELTKLSKIPLTRSATTQIAGLLEDTIDDLQLFSEGDFNALLPRWNEYESLGKNLL